MEKIPILLYHDLESFECQNEKNDVAARDTVVSAGAFKKQLQFLKESGFQTVSLEDYIGNRYQSGRLSQKSIVITFDDGHTSNFQIALPLLKKFGFKASFFAITERIGNEWHLNSEQIAEMAECGMEFGSHSHTHRFLPLLPLSDLEKELRSSKNALGKIIGKPVNAFAYPGGHYNRQVLNAVYSAGYSIGCSCLQGLNDSKTNPLLLKRLEIRRRYSMSDFQAVFDPQSIRFYQRVDFLKQMGRRILGLRNYQRIRSNLYRFYRFKR